MTEADEQLQHQEDMLPHLREVQALVARHKLVENLVHRQEMPRHDLVETLVHRQHMVELQQKLDALHPADMAYILEALPLDERLFVWDNAAFEKIEAGRSYTDAEADAFLQASKTANCGAAVRVHFKLGISSRRVMRTSVGPSSCCMALAAARKLRL